MITSLKQPVPAVGGGAIQTLITTLLDENEIHKKFRFIVISVSNKKAEAYHYNYSRIYFCHRGIIKCGFLPLTYAVCYFFKLLGKCEKTVRKMFYSSYDEKLAHLSAAVFGISYCDRINDDGITERKCKIVSNRQTGLEYSISLITSSNSAEDDIIYTSDFTDNPDFVLNPDFTGKCIIRYRKAGDKKNINEVTIDS